MALKAVECMPSHVQMQILKYTGWTLDELAHLTLVRRDILEGKRNEDTLEARHLRFMRYLYVKGDLEDDVAA